MLGIDIITKQIEILGILLVIGFLTYKHEIINTSIRDSIAKVINKITMPLLIITSISNLKLNDSMLSNGILVMIIAYFALFLLYICGSLTAKLMKIEGKTKDIHKAHIIFGNIVFLGFPLFQALYPDGSGIFYAIFFYIASESLLWTLGIYLLSKHKSIKNGSNIRHLINANTICFVLGIIMLMLKLKLPFIINEAFSGLGHTTLYLAMIFIGATLADIKIKGIYKKYSIFIMIFIKMVMVPIILIYVIKGLNILFNLDISSVAKTVLIMQTGMPCMATVAVLAKEYDSDYIYSSESVFVSTILCIFTLPFIYYLIQTI